MDSMSLDPAKKDLLILVDGKDRQIGTASKEYVHREGLLHRAFSVVLTRAGRSGTEILLSRRAEGKYHSAGLWANSCCSHPRDGEEILDAACRRVPEELGCGAEGLKEVGSFMYRAEFGNGICEYEFDHVLLGEVLGELKPDASEVSAILWIGVDELAEKLKNEPEIFSAWAYPVFSLVLKEL